MDNKLKYRLSELMKAQNISAMLLATKCQIHVQSIYNYAEVTINDRRSIPADKLKIMAEIFGVTMEEMYSESNDLIIV